MSFPGNKRGSVMVVLQFLDHKLVEKENLVLDSKATTFLLKLRKKCPLQTFWDFWNIICPFFIVVMKFLSFWNFFGGCCIC